MRFFLAAGLAVVLFLPACSGTRPLAREVPPPHPPVQPMAVTDAHYRVYTADGRPASFDDVVAAMAEADVVFVGETHDDPVAHVLEARLLQAAFTHYGDTRPVALSLEMFDRDVQYIVDEYLDSLISERHFLASASPWNNYETDYRPLLEFARVHGLDVIASNAPRRYVNRVGRLGPASLADLGPRARAALPPLPYPAPSAAYQEKWNRLMHEAMAPHGRGDAPADTAAQESPHGSPHGAAADSAGAHPASAGMPAVSNMLHAQALWDAGMGYSIASYFDGHPGALVVHVVGGFHVEGGTGTPEAVRHYRPGTRTLNVALRPAGALTSFDDAFAGYGDFVILTDARLPRTFTR